jgi:hypothetical protein
MKLATTVFLLSTALTMALPAQAAAPKLSGKYAVMSFSQCTVGFDYTSNNYKLANDTIAPAITGITTLNSGDFEIAVGTMTFPSTAASSGAASLVLNSVSGSVLRINGNGPTMGTGTQSLSGTFAVTNTSFTFTPTGGAAMTWTMSPADLVKGVARTAYLVRKEDAGCLNGLSVTKQGP